MIERRWHFQLALNAALGAYLHGSDLTRVGRVLFPLLAPARGASLQRLRAAAAPLGIVLPRDRAEALAAAFRALATLEAPACPPREFEPAPWDDRVHGAIQRLSRARARLLEAARQTGARFLLHGSFASLDFTGYSDLDTLAILPGNVVTDAGSLRRCRRAFVATWRAVRAFDPLQHHGHFVLTEVDLDGYPDALFPVAVLERTVALSSLPPPLRLRPVPVAAIGREIFRSVAERYLRADLARGLANAYRLKNDLSVFMLLPALWLQAQGRPIDKRSSFGRVYARLSPAAVDTFRRVTEIRAAWHYVEPAAGRWLRHLYFNALLPAAVDAAFARPPPPDLVTRLDPALLEDTRAAVRELLQLHDNHSEVRALGEPVA